MMRWLLIVVLCLFSGMVQAENAGEYHLGPGDDIKISIYDHPDLALETALSKDGSIAFPLIGEISLNGMSPSDAEKAIAARLSSGGFLLNPQVSILVSQFRSQRISVIGEFNHPGRFSLDSATDLVDVIALAGGIAPSGGDQIVIINGNTRRQVNLSQLMAETDPAKRVVKVNNGDVIFVPRSMVYVSGEVNRPGNYRLETGMTVMQAIAVAGGFNPRASHTSIEIHRLGADGKVMELKGRSSDQVRENDVIYVQESLF
ncbi:polysaccharide export protein EpsE [Paludibacterium yongneupense]|uniref:polysaccharide export protein EpsE n=1 Tax=Paludibacterium yongneupense TaxID=400061 RepID=UPI0003F5FC46|nr:polysaccharide export protein EpsE [Paludibacterium yongneupense]